MNTSALHTFGLKLLADRIAHATPNKYSRGVCLESNRISGAPYRRRDNLGPKLKVARAIDHIGLLSHLSAPLNRDLYEIKLLEDRPDPANRDFILYRLTFFPRRPIAENFALIIGDAVHNLRGALDHLAGGVLRSLSTDPPSKPFFPMHPDRERLIADRNLSALDAALPGAKELILNQLRPENGPDEKFWTFNTLDNADKHNLLVPNVSITDVRNIFAVIGGMTLKDMSVTGSRIPSF